MNLQKMYTALLTSDLAAAEGWYQVRDPDGNLLTLATPPSRPFHRLDRPE
jgi:hypothetical protein